MDPRRRNESGEAVDQLQWGQDLWATAAGAGAGVLVDQVLGIPLLQPSQGERRAGAIPQQSLQPWPVCGFDAYRGVHGEAAAVGPSLHRARVIAREQTAAHEALQEVAGDGSLHFGDGRLMKVGGDWRLTAQLRAEFPRSAFDVAHAFRRAAGFVQHEIAYLPGDRLDHHPC